jgi:hypothetical protein
MKAKINTRVLALVFGILVAAFCMNIILTNGNI